MLLLHSTTPSSTFGAHPQHPQPLLRLTLMNSMPQWMVVHRRPTQNLMDNMLLQHQLCCAVYAPDSLPVFIFCKALTVECQFRL